MTTPETLDIVPEGYRGPDACHASGVTYRQLDYWARTGLAEPSVVPARGSGTYRLYSREDIIRLAVVKLLLHAGWSLFFIRENLELLTHGGFVEVCVGDWPALRVTLDVNAVARAVDERLEAAEKYRADIVHLVPRPGR
jgi:DNA-binding transcriptional MerR regulator